MLYLKWTAKGRIPSYRGGAPIPFNKWTERVDNPELCHKGWHACRWEDAVHHISDELWVCELDGTIVEGDGKVVANRLRLVSQVTAIDDRTLRLFAADCAEDVLHIFETAYPDDDRPRKAIVAARAYANGEMDTKALRASADAAYAAYAAANAADAAYAAYAAAAAACAASDAAYAAANAAKAASALLAARTVQTERLLVGYGGLDAALFAHKTISEGKET